MLMSKAEQLERKLVPRLQLLRNYRVEVHLFGYRVGIAHREVSPQWQLSGVDSIKPDLLSTKLVVPGDSPRLPISVSASR